MGSARLIHVSPYLLQDKVDSLVVGTRYIKRSLLKGQTLVIQETGTSK